MTAEELIRVLLEFDQQQVTSRPSPWGKAAETVKYMARQTFAQRGELARSRLGNFETLDLFPIEEDSRRDGLHPVLDLVNEVEHWKIKAEALRAVLSLVSAMTPYTNDKIIGALEKAEAVIRSGKANS